MSTKHKMLCGQRIWNSSNKLNKMIKVKINKSLNSLVNERLVFIFSAILCEFYLIIFYGLKAKCTINKCSRSIRVIVYYIYQCIAK